MSSNKKIYVLHCLIGKTAPRIYKSKVTIKKYLQSNKSLAYSEFKTMEEAERYLSTIQNKLSQVDIKEQGENIQIDEDLSESDNIDLYTKDKFKKNYFSKE